MIQYMMHSPEQLGTLIADPAPSLAPADATDDLGQSIVTLLEDIATAYHEMEKELQTQQHPAAQLAQTLSSWPNPSLDDEIQTFLSAELNALRPRKLKRIHTTLTTCLTLLDRTNWQSFFEMQIQPMLAILSAYSHTSTAFTQLFIRSRRDSFSRYCQTSVRVVLAWCGFSHYKQMVETQRKKYQSSLTASLLSDILSQKGPNPRYKSNKEKKYEQKIEADIMACNLEYRRLSYTTALHTRINTLHQGPGSYRRKMAVQKNKTNHHPSLLKPTLSLFSASVAPPKKKVRFNFDGLSHANASPSPAVFQPPPLQAWALDTSFLTRAVPSSQAPVYPHLFSPPATRNAMSLTPLSV